MLFQEINRKKSNNLSLVLLYFITFAYIYNLNLLNMENAMKDKSTLRILKEFKHVFEYFMIFHYDADISLTYLRVLVNEIKKPNIRLEALDMALDRQLPFGDNLDVDIDWIGWGRTFDYKAASESFERWEKAVKERSDFSVIPNLQAEWEKLKTEFLFSLKKLRMHIYRIHASLNVPKKHTLLEFMKDREKEYLKIKEVNMIDNELEDLERCYQIMLYSPLLAVHIGEEDDDEYLIKADRFWTTHLTKEGKPDKAEIGLHIYRHRNELTESDLIAYHAYMELWEHFESKKSTLSKVEDNGSEHSDNYRLFAPEVDVDALYNVIKYDIIPCIKSKNQWYAVWTVLKDNSWIITATDRSFFEDQMIDWYKDAYKKKCMDTYASTCLVKAKWHEWNTAAFLNYFEKNEKHLIRQKKVSVNTVKKLATLCKKFENIIREKCIKKN